MSKQALTETEQVLFDIICAEAAMVFWTNQMVKLTRDHLSVIGALPWIGDCSCKYVPLPMMLRPWSGFCVCSWARFPNL
jgi:hypothetical protein